MARYPRFLPPNTMYEVTCRTVRGSPLLRPTRQLREAFEGVFGRALALVPSLQLHASNYLTNHGHTMLTAVHGDEVTEFMCHVKRNTSLVVQELLGRRWPVWEQRFSLIPIVDGPAAERRLQYLVANGVKEGLIKHPLEWTGFSTTRALMTGETIIGHWAPRASGRGDIAGDYPITLTRLPQWADLSETAYRRKIEQLVDNVVESARCARFGRPVMGLERLLAQDPFMPIPLEDTPAPAVHYTDEEAKVRFMKQRAAFIDAHREAAARRRGQRDPSFPPYGYPTAYPYETGR